MNMRTQRNPNQHFLISCFHSSLNRYERRDYVLADKVRLELSNWDQVNLKRLKLGTHHPPNNMAIVNKLTLSSQQRFLYNFNYIIIIMNRSCARTAHNIVYRNLKVNFSKLKYFRSPLFRPALSLACEQQRTLQILLLLQLPNFIPRGSLALPDFPRLFKFRIQNGFQNRR